VIGGAALKADPTNSNVGRKTAEKDNAETAEDAELRGEFRRGREVRSRLGVELMGWDVVVAIEFQVVEGCGDAEPARHGGGFKACDTGFADDDDVSAAHGAADQDHFQFDLNTESQFARAKEKDTAGTDIARHEGDGKIFCAASDSAEPEREPKRGSGIFALLGKNADGVSRHAGKPAHRIHRL
jgi:hypothetical protein